MDKNRENLDDQGCSKNQELFDPKAEEKMWFGLSYQLRQKTTLYCADRQAKLLDNWTKQHSML